MIFTNKYKNYHEYLKNNLSRYRYLHSVKVAKLSKKMAKKYNCNAEKAYIAGLMHDIAREYAHEELIKLAKEDGGIINDYEYQNPVLLHGRAGAVLLNNIFGINDREILGSIENHTLGSEDMDLLSKIIFVADYAVPRKTHYNKSLVKMYKNNGIDLMVAKVIENMVAYNKTCNRKELKPVADLYKKYTDGVN